MFTFEMRKHESIASSPGRYTSLCPGITPVDLPLMLPPDTQTFPKMSSIVTVVGIHRNVFIDAYKIKAVTPEVIPVAGQRESNVEVRSTLQRCASMSSPFWLWIAINSRRSLSIAPEKIATSWTRPRPRLGAEGKPCGPALQR